ncbi:MAG: hypothetical protein M0D57_02630 [Sphingobacteriales bacterium JAD_PAG50586_3]|nr:MAG: hypothetical protein M0D57_02630 [Sphingobacteriales bacterium JAD_PAG50586_3]
MKRFLQTITILLVATIVVSGFSACKRTKTVLPGTWRLERLKTSNLPYEYWIFQDGEVKICTDPNGNNVTLSGTYISTPSRITMDFGPQFWYYNGKWRVIDIDNEIMRIANFDNGGMLTREFIKIE